MLRMLGMPHPSVGRFFGSRYAVVADQVLAEPILFGDYRNVLADPDSAPGGQVLRLYEDVGSYSNIQPLFEKIMAAYNEKHKPMHLVFFDDALEHLTRIQRTLRLPLVSSGLRSECRGKHAAKQRPVKGGSSAILPLTCLAVCQNWQADGALHCPYWCCLQYRVTASWWVLVAVASRALLAWQPMLLAVECLRSA